MKAYRLVYFHITFKFQENKYKKIMYKHFTKHQKTIAQDITTYISSYVCKISFLCQSNNKKRLQSITGDFLVHTKIFGIHGEIKAKHI